MVYLAHFRMGHPLITLLLILGFYAVAFGLRTYQHLRATGSTGFRGVSGRPGSAEWLGGVLFLAGVVLSLLAPIAEMLGWVRAPWTPGPLLFPLGVLAVLLGITATYLAQISMGSSWRIGVRSDERTALVTTGPFALARNPIFTCMLFTAGALTLLSPTALALAALLSLLVAVELQVRLVEEPYLLRTHGASYRAYAARVGRFVPGFGRL